MRKGGWKGQVGLSDTLRVVQFMESPNVFGNQSSGLILYDLHAGGYDPQPKGHKEG